MKINLFDMFVYAVILIMWSLIVWITVDHAIESLVL